MKEMAIEPLFCPRLYEKDKSFAKNDDYHTRPRELSMAFQSVSSVIVLIGAKARRCMKLQLVNSKPLVCGAG